MVGFKEVDKVIGPIFCFVNNYLEHSVFSEKSKVDAI